MALLASTTCLPVTIKDRKFITGIIEILYIKFLK